MTGEPVCGILAWLKERVKQPLIVIVDNARLWNPISLSRSLSAEFNFYLTKQFDKFVLYVM